MSLSLIGYLVASEPLRMLYGSVDESALHALQQTLKQHGLWEPSQISPVLRGYLTGVPLETFAPEENAAALEIMCISAGVRLPSEAFEGLKSEAWPLVRQLDGLLNDTPIPRPFPVLHTMDFPIPFYISSEQAVDESSAR